MGRGCLLLLFQLTLNYLFELFIFERSVNQAPLPAEDQEGNQGVGGRKCELTSLRLEQRPPTQSWRSSCVGGLTMPGEARRPRAPAAFQSTSDTIALAWGRGEVELWLSRRLQKSVVVILKRPLFLEMRWLGYSWNWIWSNCKPWIFIFIPDLVEYKPQNYKGWPGPLVSKVTIQCKSYFSSKFFFLYIKPKLSFVLIRIYIPPPNSIPTEIWEKI